MTTDPIPNLTLVEDHTTITKIVHVQPGVWVTNAKGLDYEVTGVQYEDGRYVGLLGRRRLRSGMGDPKLITGTFDFDLTRAE